MPCPCVVGVGDGLHMWRVVAAVMNKQSWIDSSGYSSGFRFGHRLTTLNCKVKILCCTYYNTSEVSNFFDRTQATF
jgi:hypothetical protein